MKIRIDEKHKEIARTAVWVFTVCLLIGICFWRFSELRVWLGRIISVFSPVIWGLALAYLLSPVQVWLEKYLRKLIERKKPHPKLVRTFSSFCTLLILVLVLFGLIAAIIPELYSSIKNLLTHLPEYMTNLGNWVEGRIAGLEEDQPQLYSTLNSAWNSVLSSINNFADQFEPKLDSLASGGADLITSLTSGAVSLLSAVLDFLLGIIFALYLLFQKERYQAQARKVLYALLPEEHVHAFLKAGAHVSHTFMHFLSSKLIDSLIIGLLCFIGLTILGMPYAVLISIFIGFTNIIPFFGPIIGAIPSGLLILLSEPRKVIPFVIFILVLQQFDGNILGPKIIGDSLGLPMFWVLFAISVGGGMFGFIGMVAFIPLFAALYTFLSDFFTSRLEKKGLPSDTESYLSNELHTAAKPPAPDGSAVETKPEPDADTADTQQASETAEEPADKPDDPE